MLVRGLKLLFDGAAGLFALVAAACLLALIYGADFTRLPVWLAGGRVGVFAFAVAGWSYVLGVHRQPWRYTALNDVGRVMAIALAATLTLLGWSFLVDRANALPRAVLLFAVVFCIGFMLAGRLLSRAFGGRTLRQWRQRRAVQGSANALVIGLAPSVVSFMSRARGGLGSDWRFVGGLVVGEEWARVRLRGLPVLGQPADLNDVLAQLERRGKRVDHILVVDEDLIYDDTATQRALGQLRHRAITLWRLPRIAAFDGATGADASAVGIAGTTPQSFTFEDMLQRPAVKLDPAPLSACFAGRRVLVTGAGGSIGSELCRQLSGLGCSALICVDHSEFNLFRIDEELGRIAPDLPRAAVLCDIRDGQGLTRLFARHRPDVVFHAAALKHVTLVEQNVAAGVATNVLGTRNTHQAALGCGAQLFVLVSTDKAVAPTSAMGATKRLAETVVRAYSGAGSEQMRTMTVRFGNVLGSAGSVIPLFCEQIERGGPVTITDPEVERYFMTIPEAVQLVLHAAGYGQRTRLDGVPTCVLDMGEPVKIRQLAERICAVYGKTLGVDVPVDYIGLRPGEKLTEALVDTDEQVQPSGLPGIRLLLSRSINPLALTRMLAGLERAALAQDDNTARAELFSLVEQVRAMTAADTVGLGAPERDEALIG